MGPEIVVVGSVNADLILQVRRHPLPGETVLGHESATLPGGKGANQAVAAARLGARVAMVGAVGTDTYAPIALDGLRDAGVDLTHVRAVAGSTGLAVVTLSDDAENSIIVIPGANAAVTPQVVDDAQELIADARVCVLQAEIPLGTLAHTCAIAARNEVRVLLNVAPAAALPRETLRIADPVVVNEHEAAVLLRHRVDDPQHAAAELASFGIASVVITLGAAGVCGNDRGVSWHLDARPVVPRDTTGAGDAFVGAMAAALADGLTTQDAAAFATRVAAASVLRIGAQTSYPWKGDPLP